MARKQNARTEKAARNKKLKALFAELHAARKAGFIVHAAYLGELIREQRGW